MAVFTINKGAHYALRSMMGFFYKKEVVSKLVRFDESCTYDLNGVDQYDHNKLFGIGYFWSHKKDSARFGWRYNTVTGNIILSAYCYVNKERTIWDLCEAKINEWYALTIMITDNNYQFLVMSNGNELEHETVKKRHKKKWSFPLGVYFGGNKKAPHKMKIEILKHA